MDMFGRHDNKILGLIDVGPTRSKLAFENEYGDQYVEYFDNTLISKLNKEKCYVCFGRHSDFLSNYYEKFNDSLIIIPLFNECGELRRDLFDLVEVLILEMHKGYKKNKVLYGICKDKNENNIVINYININKLEISTGDVLRISPLELIQSKEYNKNEKLLEIYHKIINSKQKSEPIGI